MGVFYFFYFARFVVTELYCYNFGAKMAVFATFVTFFTGTGVIGRVIGLFEAFLDLIYLETGF